MGKPEAEARGGKTLFLDPSEGWSHGEDFPTRAIVIEEPAIGKELAQRHKRSWAENLFSSLPFLSCADVFYWPNPTKALLQSLVSLFF